MNIVPAKSSEHGITLAEVIIATAILGISMAGLMGIIFTGFFAIDRTRENQRATQILLEKVETIRLYNWSQVTNSSFIPSTFTQTFDPQAPSGAQGITYHGTFRVGPFPFTTSYSDKMRQITVTLNWTSRNNLNRSRTLTTFVAQDGVQNYVY